MSVRVRFAPSPTGYLHVGGARTALFNYLFAKHMGGAFILRIEDTDRTRFQQDSLNEIFTSLRWLGLEWDEGPEKGGPHASYFQSERLPLYQSCAEELISGGAAYRCFCSSERLQGLREAQEKAGVAQVQGYDRHCRCLSADEVKRQLDEGKKSVVRLKIPDGRTVVFNDLIRGPIEYKSETLDDLVLLKSDGFPTYHLANVVDDHHMAISHVLRGDEWIASTPRHVLLYEAFGWQPPLFAHMPVILSPDGGKLSKRKGAASVLDYQRSGILPEALFNFLALLGWAPGDDREKMNREEIIAAFSLERIVPKGSVLDEKKLEWMNGLYMADRTAESIAPAIISQWQEAGLIDRSRTVDDPYLLTVIRLLKDRSRRVTDLAAAAGYFFTDPVSYEEKAVKKQFRSATAILLTALCAKLDMLAAFNQQSIDKLFHDYAAETGAPFGDIIHPVRLAVSGVSFGPGLFELLEALGKETVVRRMKKAIAWINANIKDETHPLAPL